MMDSGLWTTLLVANRWVHATAAALWVGGGLVYLLVVIPAARGLRESGAGSPEAGWMTRQAVRVLGGGIGVFVLTGVVMTFQRLAEPQTSLAYVIVLILKILVSVTAFALVWKRGEMFAGFSPGPARLLLPRLFRSKGGVAIVLGSVAYLLAIVLQRIIEAGLIDR
jgi:hypothetical protein